EPDSDIAAGPGQDLRRDSDQFAAQIDERPARIALVDGGVGLQKVLEAPLVAPGRLTAFRANDAHRHGLADSERVADGENQVADFDPVGVAERHGRQARRANLDDCNVAGRVRAYDLGSEFTIVVEFHFDLIGIIDDVIISQDVSVRADDHAHPTPLGNKRPWPWGWGRRRRRGDPSSTRPWACEETPDRS